MSCCAIRSAPLILRPEEQSASNRSPEVVMDDVLARIQVLIE